MSRYAHALRSFLRWLALVGSLASGLAFVACDDDKGTRVCANETCTCGERRECSFACSHPPCHVVCERGASCEGECANGTCTCAERAACDFQCEAPPCHVTCAADNPTCNGTCANGTCDCGPGSQCDFTCESGPCHTLCGAGSSCVVHCPNAQAGTQDCDITRCESGQITICPDGKTTTCNASCPPSDGD